MFKAGKDALEVYQAGKGELPVRVGWLTNVSGADATRGDHDRCIAGGRDYRLSDLKIRIARFEIIEDKHAFRHTECPDYAIRHDRYDIDAVEITWKALNIDMDQYEELFDSEFFVPVDTEQDLDQPVFHIKASDIIDGHITARKILAGTFSGWDVSHLLVDEDILHVKSELGSSLAPMIARIDAELLTGLTGATTSSESVLTATDLREAMRALPDYPRDVPPLRFDMPARKGGKTAAMEDLRIRLDAGLMTYPKWRDLTVSSGS